MESANDSGRPESESTVDNANALRLASMQRVERANAVDRCGNLLQSLGWGAGNKVPFANAENRKLEKELEMKQRKILNLRILLEDAAEHAGSLEHHQRRIKEDIHMYHNLLKNKKAILQDEKSFLDLTKKMLSRYAQEKDKVESKILESQRSSDIWQKELDKKLKGILEIRDLINFDSAALTEYQRRIQEFEDLDNEVKKLSAEDARRIRELEISRAELSAFTKELRHQLDQEAMNTTKFHEQFDRLSIEFKKLHRQRRDMVSLWSATIQAMQDKDLLMQEIADEYYATKKRLRALADELEEKERILRSLELGTEQAHIAISGVDRRIVEVRRQYEDHKELMENLRDALSVCKLEIDYGTNQAQERKFALSQVDQDKEKLMKQRDKLTDQVALLKNQLHLLENESTETGSYIDQLEQILENEEREAEYWLKQMEYLKQRCWEKANERVTTMQDIKGLDMAILRTKAVVSRISTKTSHFHTFLGRRQSLIYKLGLEISVLEHKIGLMTNPSVDPRYFEMQTRVVKLKQILERIVKEKNFDQREIEHVRLQTIKCNDDIAKNRKDSHLAEQDLKQCATLTHSLEKLMDKALNELNQEQVKNSLEKVYLKRLVDAMRDERRQLFGLSEIRNTIYMAVKERNAEIESHKKLNISRKKSLSETISKLKVQVVEVRFRSNKLRGRYDIVVKSMTGSNDVSEEEESLGFQVKRAARERESLQLEMQNWKGKVAEAEKELEALTNVRTMMEASNCTLKESLSPAHENSRELKVYNELNAQEQEILLRRNRAKNYRTLLKEKIHEIEQRTSVLDHEIKSTMQIKVNKEAIASKVQNELQRQREKVVRWKGLCDKILKEVKPMFPEDQFDLLQLDLKYRFTVSKYEIGVGMLEKLVNNYPALKKYFLSMVKKDPLVARIYEQFTQTLASSYGGYSDYYSDYSSSYSGSETSIASAATITGGSVLRQLKNLTHLEEKAALTVPEDRRKSTRRSTRRSRMLPSSRFSLQRSKQF